MRLVYQRLFLLSSLSFFFPSLSSPLLAVQLGIFPLFFCHFLLLPYLSSPSVSPAPKTFPLSHFPDIQPFILSLFLSFSFVGSRLTRPISKTFILSLFLPCPYSLLLILTVLPIPSLFSRSSPKLLQVLLKPSVSTLFFSLQATPDTCILVFLLRCK